MPIKYDDQGKLKRPNKELPMTRDNIEEFMKCANSVTYFAENYYYIINPVKGASLIPLRDYQVTMLENMQNNRFNILLAARQVGKTTCSAIYMLWYAMFQKYKCVAILANKADLAKAILDEIKYAYEELPEFLKPGATEYNAFNVKFDNNSEIICKATSPDALRGLSVSLLMLDEFAFVPSGIANQFWAANYPTLATGGAAIVVSTPNGTGNLYHELWTGALKKENTFVPTKVNWRDVPERDDAWKEETIKNIGKVRFNQEFECLKNDSLIKVRYQDKTYLVKIGDLYAKGKDFLQTLQPID